MLRTIALGVVNMLGVVFFTSFFLLGIIGIGSLSVGFPQQLDECLIQTWLIILGVIAVFDICLCAGIALFYINSCKPINICESIKIFFLFVSMGWLEIGVLLHNDTPSFSMIHCKDEIVQTYNTSMIVVFVLVSSLFLAYVIIVCFNLAYIKEDESVLKEPLLPEENV
jgi:hypothetical protein